MPYIILVLCLLAVGCSSTAEEQRFALVESYLLEKVGHNANPDTVESLMLVRLRQSDRFKTEKYIPLYWGWSKGGKDGVNRLSLSYAAFDNLANEVELEDAGGTRRRFSIPPEYIAENAKDIEAGRPSNVVIRTGDYRNEIRSIRIMVAAVGDAQAPPSAPTPHPNSLPPPPPK